ncbi:MAG: aminoglycoside phosphotransferase family protein [Deltaproteobacteria bacterium]|nr:aminoglycoside phosphotransferase family protein [Deltaproteobacteria bacterium]
MFSQDPTIEEARESLFEFYGVKAKSLKQLSSGKVNRSFLVECPERGMLVLQFISPVFQKSPALGINWERATRKLLDNNIPAPSIIPALDGSLLYNGKGFERLLRLTRFLEGASPAVGDLSEARACGKALGLAHTVLNTPRPLELVPLPAGVEYTNQRLPHSSDFSDFETLYRLHPKLSAIEGELERGARLAASLPGSPQFQRIFLLKDLVVHGDPKRDNFLGSGKSYSLIDWDTVSYGDPLLDLSELCRSLAVQKEPPLFNDELAREAVLGYQESGLCLPKSHFQHLTATIRAIAITLARRYLADSLLENYFVWDKEHYPSHFEQDLTRANALFDLSEELLDREMELYNICG